MSIQTESSLYYDKDEAILNSYQNLINKDIINLFVSELKI